MHHLHVDVCTRVCFFHVPAAGPSMSGPHAHESMCRCQLLCHSPAGLLLSSRVPWQPVVIHNASPVLMSCGTARLARHPSPYARRTRRQLCVVHGRHVWGARVSCKFPFQSTSSAGAPLRRADPCMSVRSTRARANRQAFTFSRISGTLPCPALIRRLTLTGVTSMALSPAHCTANPTQRGTPQACEQRA